MSSEQAIGQVLGGYKGDKGSLTHRVHSAATTNPTVVRAGVATLGMIEVYNLSASYRFLKLYDKASAPNPAVDTPIWTIPLEPSGGYDKLPKPINFTNGIAYLITGAVADNDATAIGAADVTGVLGWAP